MLLLGRVLNNCNYLGFYVRRLNILCLLVYVRVFLNLRRVHCHSWSILGLLVNLCMLLNLKRANISRWLSLIFVLTNWLSIFPHFLLKNLGCSLARNTLRLNFLLIRIRIDRIFFDFFLSCNPNLPCKRIISAIAF